MEAENQNQWVSTLPIPVLSLEYDSLLPYSPLMTNRGELTWPLSINAICHPRKDLDTHFGHAVS